MSGDTAVFEDLLQKQAAGHGAYVMTPEEAAHVWQRYHDLIDGNRELQVLSLLRDQLEHETSTGARCAVCGRYKDDRCIDEC